MNAASIVLACVALSAFCTPLCAVDSPQDLGPVLEPTVQKFKGPAAAAAVVRNGKIVALGATGVRSLETKDAVALSDRSLIGSCGKSATRLLIGRLVDKGKLRWDSTLGELLVDVPMREEYKSVTLGDIIGHKAGLQPYTMISPQKTPVLFKQSGGPREQRAAFVAHLLSEQPAAAPKSRFVYSNAGYGLLGHIAERLMDKPYEQLMRDEVFRPLGMDTAIVGRPGAAANGPGWTGHLKTAGGFEPVAERQPLPAIAPAGTMSMSIEDFARLAAALVEVERRNPTDFLGAGAVERLPELRPGSRGEGEIFFGGDGHFTAAFALWPSQGDGIVVQTNAGESDDLCRALVEAVQLAVAPEVQSSQLAAMATPNRPRYGFQIKAEAGENEWEITGIDEKSIAARSDLQPGDRIMEVNGKPLANIDPDEAMAALKGSPVQLKIRRGESIISRKLELP